MSPAEVSRDQGLDGLSHTAVHGLYQCCDGGHDAVNGQFHLTAIAQDLIVGDGRQDYRAQIQQTCADADDEDLPNGLPHAERLGQLQSAALAEQVAAKDETLQGRA